MSLMRLGNCSTKNLVSLFDDAVNLSNSERAAIATNAGADDMPISTAEPMEL